jgi:hypothetical protein
MKEGLELLIEELEERIAPDLLTISTPGTVKDVTVSSMNAIPWADMQHGGVTLRLR